MAQDHIDRLRRAYAAFSRGDFDKALTYAHPDIEYVPAEGAAPVRGLETFRASHLVHAVGHDADQHARTDIELSDRLRDMQQAVETVALRDSAR